MKRCRYWHLRETSSTKLAFPMFVEVFVFVLTIEHNAYRYESSMAQCSRKLYSSSSHNQTHKKLFFSEENFQNTLRCSKFYLNLFQVSD